MNRETHDFQLYIYNELSQDLFDSIITICQNLGYFPAVIKIDNRDLLDDYKEYCNFNNVIKNNIDYIDFLKTLTFNNFEKIYFQFENYKYLKNIINLNDN